MHVHGSLARYVNCVLRMHRECRERFSSPPGATDPDMHHGKCVTHVPWCMPGSLTSSFLWNLRWWGKRSRHSQCMRNPQFYVSGKRPMLMRHTHQSPWTLSVLCYQPVNISVCSSVRACMRVRISPIVQSFCEWAFSMHSRCLGSKPGLTRGT